MLRSLLNQHLGRYYIKELLGRGGMAVVYRAADMVLQRDVALKVLYPQYSDDVSLVERFQREAVTAAALEHPHIVPIYDVGEQDGMAYIAMKLLEGRTFQDRLQEAGAIGLEELLAVLEPVASALDYAHGRGIVHRDIKPGNIFLSRENGGLRPVLTDFGIAKQLDAPGLTTTGALIGTPDYMAPEQIAGRPLDARVDVYALGMVAFRALAGRRAFEGTTQDVLLGHLYGQAPRPSSLNAGLPAGVDDVVAAAIAAERAERYPGAGAFVTALRHVARAGTAATAVGTPVVARPAAPSNVVAGQTSAPTARGSLPTSTATAPTQEMTPPPTRRAAPAPPQRVAPSSAMPDQQLRRPLPVPEQPAASPAARGAGIGPWLLALVLAVAVGGLAMALFFVLRDRDAQPGEIPPPAPPSATPEPATATPEPPSPTVDPALLITTTAEPATATPEPATATATLAPATATLVPATAVPPPPPPTATPTLTPQPPTATVTPEPPTATPTASATPTTVAACPTELLRGGFGRLYEASRAIRDALGCPVGPEQAGVGSQQFFARGTMFYWGADNQDELADSIVVFYGRNSGMYDTFSRAQAELLPEATPGPDPNQPVRGFGRVYFNHPQAAERLGPWTSPEIELTADQLGVVQYFDKGMMIWTPDYRPTGGRSIFVLYNDGTFERYDDAFAG